MATAVAAAATERPSAIQSFKWAVSDSLLMTKRSLLVWIRVPAYLVFTVVQPVIFVLLFRYVFGGAIQTGDPKGYVNYLMPGIIGQTAAFATFATAIALAQEAKSGVIDRLRSLPMARSAVLAGRLIADSIRMMITILVIVAVGYAVGFHFEGGFGNALAMIVLAEVFGVSIATVAAAIGLAIKDEESVQAFGLIWLFPLTFISSAFVRTDTMPGWMQAFADHQPVTLVINAMRWLADPNNPAHGPLNPSLWQGLLWLVGIVVVFAPLAVRAYKRA